MTSWTWGWLLRNFLAEILMPPLLWIALAFLGMYFFKKRDRIFKGWICICLFAMWVSSSTVFANWLIMISDEWMHWPNAVDVKTLAQVGSKQPRDIGAIVILGGGRRKGALERVDQELQDISSETLQRIRMGARLAKQTGLPVLVTGGAPDGSGKYSTPEATLMAQVLEQEFGVKVKWIEDKSATTQENALFTKDLLATSHIQKIYLVTQFSHMPRAIHVFEKYGIESIPVASGYEYSNQLEWSELNPLDFLPSVNGTRRVHEVWHESLGMIWYQIRH